MAAFPRFMAQLKHYLSLTSAAGCRGFGYTHGQTPCKQLLSFSLVTDCELQTRGKALCLNQLCLKTSPVDIWKIKPVLSDVSTDRLFFLAAFIGFRSCIDIVFASVLCVTERVFPRKERSTALGKLQQKLVCNTNFHHFISIMEIASLFLLACKHT